MQSRQPGEFAVALSGGGHRATLFAIGALMALVDRGLNRRVVQISSVSGGSIANAFVAQRCHFDRLGPGELDPIAAELIGTIVAQGRAVAGVDRADHRRVDRHRCSPPASALWLLGLPSVLACSSGCSSCPASCSARG